MWKEKFCELMDSEVTEKLSRFKIGYPRSVLAMCVYPTRSNEQISTYFSIRKKKMITPNADKGGIKLVVVATLQIVLVLWIIILALCFKCHKVVPTFGSNGLPVNLSSYN